MFEVAGHRQIRTMAKFAFFAGLLIAGLKLDAATMYSSHNSFGGVGTFYGPGSFEDSELFEVTIRNIGFLTDLSFITPMVNNGGEPPNTCGDKLLREKPTGLLSDGKTRVNENVDVCPFILQDMKIMVGIIDGESHQGEQIAVTLENGALVMTMDTALDLGIGEAGIIRIPFYATTGSVSVPSSLQTQLGIPGGIDRAGSLASGTKLNGRFGDYNDDGLLDGAIVLAGNIPLDSMLLPGAPYAFIRYFDTDVPVDGDIYGPRKQQPGQ